MGATRVIPAHSLLVDSGLAWGLEGTLATDLPAAAADDIPFKGMLMCYQYYHGAKVAVKDLRGNDDDDIGEAGAHGVASRRA